MIKSATYGFAWIGSTKFVEQVFSWIISIFLARLLSADDYGLIAISSILIMFTAYFGELSIGSAIIQKEHIDEGYLSSGFWFVVTMGIVCFAITYLISDSIASFFSQAQLGSILRISGLALIIMSIGIIPQSLISRHLRFDLIGKANVLSSLSMGGASLVGALLGLGVWSLVIGFVIKNLVFSVFIFYHSSWRPSFDVSLTKIKELVKFGAVITVSKILDAVHHDVDKFIVGKFLGSVSLGYYYMAFHIPLNPIHKLGLIIYDVNLPVLARLQDTEEIKKHFLSVTRVVSIFVFPALGGLLLVAEDFVSIVLGTKWLPVIQPLRLVCVIGILRSMDAMSLPLLISRGRADLNLRCTLTSAIVLPASLLIGTQFGLAGVMYAWIIVSPLVTAYRLKLALSEIRISFRDYVKAVLPAVEGLAFMAAACVLFQYLVVYSSIWRLMGTVLCGALTYVAFLVIVKNDFLSEIQSMFYYSKTRKVDV